MNDYLPLTITFALQYTGAGVSTPKPIVEVDYVALMLANTTPKENK